MQGGLRISSVGVDGLLGKVVEKMGNEGLVSQSASGGHGGDVVDTADRNLSFVLVNVAGNRVYRLPVILEAVTANGIEVFKAESHRINNPVAFHA